MSVNRFYKAVPKKAPDPISFVALVKAHGDNWRVYAPNFIAKDYETFGPDRMDALKMKWIEEGIMPRIGYDQV